MILLTAMAIVAVTVTEIWEQAAPLLGLVVPLVVAWLVKAEATARTKQLVALAVTIAAAAVSVALEDWSTVTVQLVVERLLVVAGEAQLVYVAVSAAVAQWFGTPSMNELGLFRPERGVGRAA